MQSTSGPDPETAALASLTPESARLVETLLWLCRIPSPTGEEGPICEALIERLGRAPLAAPVRRYGHSIVVPVTRGGDGVARPKIALVGHTDVVRTSHDGPVRVEGDRLFGPGASDMKSGLALMLDLVENERDALTGVDLTLVFYAREEGPFLENELGAVLAADEELRAVDLAVCMEPSDNKLSLGAAGSIHAKVTFTGRTAHSARPWQGDNAIHKAGPLLCDLAARQPREVTLDGLVYRTVTTATMAHGGRGRNVVPDELSLNLNHRFSPDTSIAEAQREIEALVAGRAHIEWLDLSPAAPPHAAHPLVATLRAAGVRAVEPKQAWTDVARFATFDVAAVNFGPGDNAQAHQRNESTSIDQLCQGRAIVRRWLGALGKAELPLMATLSSLLVQRSIAPMQAVEDAIARQVLSGGDLATNLLEVGAAREDDITRLAAESAGLTTLAPGKIAPVDAAVLRLLPGDVALRHGILPLEQRGDDLVVATSEPLSQRIADDLGFLLNLDLRPVYALRVRILQALAEHYGQPIERRYARLLAKLEGRTFAPETAPPPPAPAAAPAEVPAQAATPQRSVMAPQRPTLRGLAQVVATAIAGAAAKPRTVEPSDTWDPLPTTIELSPRPPAAEPSPEPARAEAEVPARQPRVPPAASPAPAASLPQAISDWARASVAEERAARERAHTEVRERRQGRSRRKGPFPAALAEEELQSAITTESVLETFFDFVQQFFEYAALFVVHGDIAEGRDAAGRGADRHRVTAIGLPLDLPSTLASARDQRVPVIAHFAVDGLDAELLTDLGRSPAADGIASPTTAPAGRAAAAVIPIVVRGRAVALLFGDDAPIPVELDAIGEVIAFAALAGASIERIVLRRKLGRTGAPPTARIEAASIAAISKMAAPPPAPDPSAAALIVAASPAPAPEVFASPEIPLVAAASPAPAPVAAASLSPAPGAAQAHPARPDPRRGMAALARMFGGKRAGAPAAPAQPTRESSPPPAPNALVDNSETLAAVVVESLAHEPDSAQDIPGIDESIAIALQTPSFADATVSFPEPEPSELDADSGASPVLSSGGALTVALLLPGDTPPPVHLGEPPRPQLVVVDDAADLSAADLSAADLSAADLSAADLSAADLSGDVGDVEHIPDEALETVAPGDVHAYIAGPGAPAPAPDHEASSDSIGAAIASLSGDLPESDDGRPSAPVIVDISADSNDGLATALARAADAVDARARREPFAPASTPRPTPAAAQVDPPQETLTEGFPAVSEPPPALSPDDDALTMAFVTPPPVVDALSGPVAALTIDALLARATRGYDVSAARNELRRRADHDLTALIAAFPGPIEQDRHRSADRLPPASQCGPLLDVFVRAGARGAVAVASLARHDDIEARFWAAHLLGEITSPEAADALLAFLVDTDAAVRRAALRAAAALLAASLPGRPLETGLGRLARDAHASLRERTTAIDTMGQLRVASVTPILVDLLAASPDDIGEAARRALLVVTRQDFARDPQRWTEWWRKNESRHRIEWLIDALMHDTQSIRRAAGDELKQLTKEYFGYYDDLPKRERERAQERYREWWERDGRARFR